MLRMPPSGGAGRGHPLSGMRRRCYFWSMCRVRVAATIVLATLALGAADAGAGIYRYVDESGTVVYTDKPRPGAEKVELPGISVYRGRVPEGLGAARPAPGPDRAPAYRAVRIVSPAHDQAFWSAVGEVVIQVETDPPLDIEAGHRLRLFMDGRPVGEPLRSGAVRLRNVNPGTHTLRAEVTGAQGEVLAASDSVTFHLLRPSVLRPRPP